MVDKNAFGDQIGTIEDVAAPIVAYRLFNVCNDFKLRSVTRQILWPTAKEGGLVAECLSGKNEFKNFDPPCDYPVPAHANNGFGCGIYAAKSIEKLQKGNWGGQVIGRVLLGGRVHEHDHGYRAEFAAVDAIYDRISPMPPMFHPYYTVAPYRQAKPQLTSKDLIIVAKHYEVPLLPFPKLVSPSIETKGDING